MTRNVTRRGVLRSLLGGSLAVTAGVTAGGATVAAKTPIRGHWHQHGADGANTSRTDARGPQYNQRPRWRRELPSADSAPLVVENMAYVLDVAGDSATVHALSAAAGTTRWERQLPGAVVSGVLAADDRHVFTADVVDSRVVALDRETGETRWTQTFEDESAHQLGVSGGFRTPPRLQNGQLYLKTRTSGSAPASIVALDVATGEPERAFAGPFTHFAVGTDRLVAARGSPSLDDHGLDVFEVQTGDPLPAHSYETDGRPGQPTMGEDRLFVGTSENVLHAVDGSGERAWTAETDDWALSLALAAGVVVAKSGASLLAFDADTGDRLWSTDSVETRPVVGDGVVYVGRVDGFDGYDVTTGEQVISYRDSLLGGRVSQLSIAGGALLGTAPRGLAMAVRERLPGRFARLR